jgi:putative peptidoglycan lipid II flippase
MFKRLLSVGGFTLLSRITGFIRDILQAAVIGAGPMSDAFLVAFTLPNYFRQIFGEGAINPAFLPRYAALYAKGERDAAALFADRVFAWQMLAQLVVLLAALLCMPLVIDVIAPGFAKNPGQYALTVNLARITFPYLILTVVAIQLSAMLNAIEKFWAAAAWSNFQNLGMIATLLCARFFPNAAYAAAWGVFLGGFMQLFFMLWASRRDGLTLHFAWPVWTTEISAFFRSLGAVSIGSAGVFIAPFIDTILASLLPAGSRTALYYADRINQLPLGVLGVALGTVLLPAMASKLAVNDRDGSDAAQNRAATLSILLTLPFATLFIAIPDTIMRAIFAHGAFDKHAAALSAVALVTYSVGLPAMALVRILQATFYARQDTGTPVRITLAALACNIALKFVFVWGLHLGIAGIALGTSVGAWINVALLVFLGARHRLLHINSEFRKAFVPVIAAGVLTGVASYGAVHLIGPVLTLPRFKQEALLLIAGLCGVAVYGGVVLAFRSRLPLGKFARG